MSSPEALVSKPHETPSSASASPPASAPAPTPTAPAPTPTPTPAPVPPSASPTFTSSLHSSMSPSVPFYEKRSVGRVFGTLLMASGTLPAYYFYKKLQYLAALLGGVFPVAVGMYLISKPYLKDPEALKDYRNEYDSSPLAAGVREKSWTVSYLLNFVAPYEIKAKFLEEVGTSNGLEKIWKLYGKDFLGELLKMEVVSRTFFEEQFLVDRSNAKTVFSSEPFIDRVNLYGVWLVDNAKVKAETVASALDNDPKTLALTFPELVQKGSRKLLGRKLISVRALHVPCMSELSRIGFGKMETKRRGEKYSQQRRVRLIKSIAASAQTLRMNINWWFTKQSLLSTLLCRSWVNCMQLIQSATDRRRRSLKRLRNHRLPKQR
eukprot:TRINITY_DN2129_c0_g1_i1.p1 TRINITY_DN2129_c0_g1~~TRINITY_DN2129_c0_g1_i1.p1  ORF type:complete len:378 (+),score=50.26 TRINITY_DN2129_c0_g1_i1:71-1204(+)